MRWSGNDVYVHGLDVRLCAYTRITVRWSGNGVYVHGLDVRLCAYTRVVNGSM